jgi:iron complex outermembrane receptor protein
MRSTSERLIAHGGLKRTLLSLALTVACSFASLSSGVVSAQTPAGQSTVAAPDTAAATIQEVVITGSRIAAPNATSTSPIQVVSSESIQTTGKSDVTDMLNQLPQIFNNGIGQDLGNGTSGLSTPAGVSTADLRGLGPNRTLVLVDGRRLGQGSPNTAIASPAPDLDQIPAGLVDRVEVVTGGASAAYGSDAIAGVVNFIMKKNFQGFQLNAQGNENWHYNHETGVQKLVREFGDTPATGTSFDGTQKNFSMLMGTNFADGNGNVTAYLSYRHADPVVSSQRDFGACQLNPVNDKAKDVVALACAGSSNSNYFNPFAPGLNTSSGYNVSGTSLVPFGSVTTSPPPEFNSEKYIYLTREDDRYNAAVLGHLTLNDYVKPYAEFYFMNDRTNAAIAPSGLFKDSNPLDPTGSGGYPVNCDNPLLSAQEASVMCSPAQLSFVAANPGQGCIFNTDPVTGQVTSPNCADVRIGRRNIEGGGRRFVFEHTNYRAVFGTKGNFGDAWTYDAYGQYYYTTFYNDNENFLGFPAIDNALQVKPSANGPVCISGGSCVPYNIWSAGGVTAAQLAPLYQSGTAYGTTTLRTLHGEITGELGKYGITSPWSNDGVAIDVGYEHRGENVSFAPDAAELSGNLSGFGSASVAINNGVSVADEFAEIRAPLVQNKPGFKELLFDAGFRHSGYSSVAGVNTAKFEVQYAPVEDYRFRFSFDRAIRAPNIIELFNPQLVATTVLGSLDPCAPTTDKKGNIIPAAFTLAQCLNTRGPLSEAQMTTLYGNGSTTDLIPQGTGGQLSELTGGNTQLKPEIAKTYTVGLNFAPQGIPHFAGSLDYYHILVSGEINTIPAQIILSNCGNLADPFYCSQIFRNPRGNGNLDSVGAISGGGYIVQTDLNVATVLVSGIDAQLSYKHDLPGNWGGIAFALNGAYLLHVENQPVPGGHTYDCAGLYGATCQTVNFKWHHILRTMWSMPGNVNAALTWRYLGPVSLDSNSSDPTLNGGFVDRVEPRIPGYNYFDLEATWNATSALTVRAGINNVLDKDPPILNVNLVPGGAANTNPVYDYFGRELFAGFTLTF